MWSLAPTNTSALLTRAYLQTGTSHPSEWVLEKKGQVLQLREPALGCKQGVTQSLLYLLFYSERFSPQ